MKYKVKITDFEKKEINISEDEITEVKYSKGLREKNDYANNRSSVEMEIRGKVISNLESINNENTGKSVNEDLYEKNKKNIIELAKWAKSYLGKNDYRNIEVTVDLGGNKTLEYSFSNMFVYDFSQEFSIEKGIGIFIMNLKQKFHQKSDIEIK